MAFLDDLLDACDAQAHWMENSTYGWQNNPTIAKSQYKGTCVTYVACVLQRIGILASGKYIWHNKHGDVTGATDTMTVLYFSNKTLSQIKDNLQAGDIIMDGDKTDLNLGSHIFIITGEWDGLKPYVWDNTSGQNQRWKHVYQRDRSIIAVVRLNAIEPFVPRLSSAGMSGNPYWYSRNPFYLAGYGLPNCTCYAWGRFWEIADSNHDYSNRPNLSTSDAEDWYNYNDGYERGSTPRLGAVLCLADGPFSGAGHVAIVEEIYPDGSITCSNSAWNGSYFYLTTLQPPLYLPTAGYIFQGFIYNPHAGGRPRTSGTVKTWMMKRWLWNREDEIVK